MKLFRPTRSNWVNRRVYLGSPHSRCRYRYPSLLRTLEGAMRAPTLKRWVHYREVWGGPLLTIFFVDSRLIAAIITSRLGDVAQLGERCRRMAEAEGSIPFVSTNDLSRLRLRLEPFSCAPRESNPEGRGAEKTAKPSAGGAREGPQGPKRGAGGGAPHADSLRLHQ